MATFQAVFVPTSPTSSTLFNGTILTGATTTVTLGNRSKFAITVSGNCTVRFGNSTKAPTATAADWPIWAQSIQEWDTGEEMDRISIFNNTAGTITYWVYEISSN